LATAVARGLLVAGAVTPKLPNQRETFFALTP